LPSIFFSWQSDTPSREGRNFVDKALHRAVERISEDTTVEDAIREELTVERDTQGVPGYPSIVDTILERITKTAVFVADLTFVGERINKQPTPNPNVLIEYGWALKSIGPHRIIPLMNEAFGSPQEKQLPFDLRHLRHPITYNCSDDADDDARKKTLESLSRTLESAIKAILDSPEYKSSLIIEEAPRFVELEPQQGRGRFVAASEPIGVSEGFLDRAGREVKLFDRPLIWLRVIPTTPSAITFTLKNLREAHNRGELLLVPISPGWQNFDHVRRVNGFGTFPIILSHPETTYAVTMAFVSGEVWSIDAYTLDALKRNGHDGISLQESHLEAALRKYCNYLARLGLTPPYKWIAGIEGVRGKGIFLPERPGRSYLIQGPRGSCMTNIVECSGIYDGKSDPRECLTPFFNQVFQSCGVEHPVSLNALV